MELAQVDAGRLFEAVPAPLALVSPELVFVEVNPDYEKVMGRSRDQILGRGVFEVFRGDLSGEQAQAVRYSLERVLAEGKSDLLPMYRYDVENPDKPGLPEERYWNITNAPVLDDQGAVVGILIQPQDVTFFVRNQNRKPPSFVPGVSLPHLAAIESRLSAQTGELCEINQQLRQAHLQERQAVHALRKAVRQQREALADASHDLRNPLAGLLLRLQEALDDLEADPRKVLQDALKDAEHLSDIVGDLLELARLESGTRVKSEPVNLSRSVASELLRLSPKAAVTTHLDPGVFVEGSRPQLARLVANLVANADRHADSRVEVVVGKQGDRAVLEVIDDGAGIPDEDKEAVFRRFYRRADAREHDPGGTGLGLAISRQIAHAHHGTLEATDRTDQRSGARLVLSLPLSTAETAEVSL